MALTMKMCVEPEVTNNATAVCSSLPGDIVCYGIAAFIGLPILTIGVFFISFFARSDCKIIGNRELASLSMSIAKVWIAASGLLFIRATCFGFSLLATVFCPASIGIALFFQVLAIVATSGLSKEVSTPPSEKHESVNRPNADQSG